MTTTPADVLKLVNTDCEAQLAFILAEEHVPLQTQYDIVAGRKMKAVKTVRRLAGLEDSREAMRKLCKDELGIDRQSRHRSCSRSMGTRFVNKNKGG